MKNIIDYDSLLHHIFPILIGQNMLGTMPEDIAAMEYLDLFVIFSLEISDKAEETFSLYVSNKFLDSLQLSSSRDESRKILFLNALVNAKREHPAKIRSIADALQYPDGFERDTEVPFYVLSNQSGHFGASALLYRNVLEQFAATTGEDFCIIPSSMHEVLLIPDSLGIGIYDLHEILIEVNSSVLQPIEILSTNIYRYISGAGIFLVKIYGK